jgi:hypothetical protein
MTRATMKYMTALSFVLTTIFVQAGTAAEQAGQNQIREPPQPRSVLLQRFLERFDSNGDGKVAKKEFTGALQFFQRLDRNSDDVATLPNRRRSMPLSICLVPAPSACLLRKASDSATTRPRN